MAATLKGQGEEIEEAQRLLHDATHALELEQSRRLAAEERERASAAALVAAEQARRELEGQAFMGGERERQDAAELAETRSKNVQLARQLQEKARELEEMHAKGRELAGKFKLIAGLKREFEEAESARLAAEARFREQDRALQEARDASRSAAEAMHGMAAQLRDRDSQLARLRAGDAPPGGAPGAPPAPKGVPPPGEPSSPAAEDPALQALRERGRAAEAAAPAPAPLAPAGEGEGEGGRRSPGPGAPPAAEAPAAGSRDPPTPAASTPAASTPAASTPAASTPAALTPAASRKGSSAGAQGETAGEGGGGGGGGGGGRSCGVGATFAKSGGGFAVTSVDEGHAVAAGDAPGGAGGLRVGDLAIGLNDTPLAEMGAEAFRDAVTGPPQSKVSLLVVRVDKVAPLLRSTT